MLDLIIIIYLYNDISKYIGTNLDNWVQRVEPSKTTPSARSCTHTHVRTHAQRLQTLGSHKKCRHTKGVNGRLHGLENTFSKENCEIQCSPIPYHYSN